MFNTCGIDNVVCAKIFVEFKEVNIIEPNRNSIISTPITLLASDRYRLSAHCWHIDKFENENCKGVVLINPATGVRADYYHRYAHFLAENNYVVLTYDYRGIGASRPENLRLLKTVSTSDWGQRDCEAALLWIQQNYSPLPIYVIGHSIGGMVAGFAPSNHLITRCITVGAQFGYWRDYARSERFSMWLRWQVAMPILTAICGYCPAKAMGWHEDLPAAAAYEWAFRRGKLISTWGAKRMPLKNFSHMTCDIVAVEIKDDPIGTSVALNRLLAYFNNCHHHRILISPESVSDMAIGHFGFFHNRFRTTLWRESLRWISADCADH